LETELIEQAPIAQTWWLGAQQYVLAVFGLMTAAIASLAVFIFRRTQTDMEAVDARVKTLEDERIALTELTSDVRSLVNNFRDFQSDMEKHHAENKKLREDDTTESRRWREEVFAAISTSVTQHTERIASLQDRMYALENLLTTSVAKKPRR
jgi:uncharacterized coiled-coil protein SlyX